MWFSWTIFKNTNFYCVDELTDCGDFKNILQHLRKFKFSYFCKSSSRSPKWKFKRNASITIKPSVWVFTDLLNLFPSLVHSYHFCVFFSLWTGYMIINILYVYNHFYFWKKANKKPICRINFSTRNNFFRKKWIDSDLAKIISKDLVNCFELKNVNWTNRTEQFEL